MAFPQPGAALAVGEQEREIDGFPLDHRPVAAHPRNATSETDFGPVYTRPTPNSVVLGSHEGLVELLVETAGAAQLVVAPGLDDPAVVEDDDQIGVGDRGESVGDDE